MAGLVLVLTLTALAGLEPQEAAPSRAEEPFALEDVEIRSRRGAALVEPEIELDGAQIDAVGAYDIGELIRRLTEDHALGDSPVIIVNGRRMADPGVFDGFPPDALVRVEVLPPEAGGLYGADDPSRRVVNIVLQRRFNSRDGRASVRRPTAGGLSNANLDLRQSSIIDARTRQLGFQADVDTALRAGERDQDRNDQPGGEAVTLRPASESFVFNLTQTASLGDWAASLRAGARTQENRSVALRDGEAVDSRRRSRGLTMTGGLNGEVAGWSMQATLSGLLTQTDQSGLSPSESDQRSISGSLAVGRTLFDLPAGPLTANLSGRASRARSSSARPEGDRTSSGRSVGLSGSLSIPLTPRPSGTQASGLLGGLSVTLGADLNETESGRGEGLNAALAWTPLPKLRFNASWSTSSRSVLDQQRFEPEYYGEPIVVFDFLTGEAVEVLPILGGNPDLRPPSSERISLSASAGPFTDWKLQGGVSLQRIEAVDGIDVLPDPTPEVEAAFPGRFERDAGGRLISIDRRPINIRSALNETLNSNLTFAVPPPAVSGAVLRVTLNHTRRLRNVTVIADGLPEMDRLSGDGGGLSRQEFAVMIDGRMGQWGLNAGARWRDGYRLRRDTGRDGPQDLRVAAFSTVGLKIEYAFERAIPGRAEGAPSRRGVGLQLELEVDNLFDARPDASLGDGGPAPGYGRDDRDPVGRTVRLTLKRRF